MQGSGSSLLQQQGGACMLPKREGQYEASSVRKAGSFAFFFAPFFGIAEGEYGLGANYYGTTRSQPLESIESVFVRAHPGQAPPNQRRLWKLNTVDFQT